MHNKTPLFAAACAAVLSLSACNSEPETIVAGGPQDPQAEALNNAAPVELPPAISASRTYRCKDNSLLYAEFLTNNTARVRKEQGGEPTVLTAPAEGQAYTAEGYSLSANSETVTYAAPGKPSQSCKA
jgi:hypothetical protein